MRGIPERKGEERSKEDGRRLWVKVEEKEEERGVVNSG